MSLGFGNALVCAQSGAAQGAPQTAPTAPAPAASSIRGVVKGKEGEVYQGVSVTLVLKNGGAAQSQQTTAAGEFLFEQVAPGPFTLSFASPGFDPQTVSGVIQTGESYVAPDVVLGMKETVSNVRVSAEAQVLLADEQIHVEEQQHVLGFMPNYYVNYDRNPMPLTSKQKFKLAWHTNVDPFNWLMNAGFSGIQQATNSFKGYGQGMQGFGKRMGANTADSFFSDMIGDAILPSLFHQDPRYFYKGTGSIRSRMGYALANTVICKGDNMRWQFNYSGILGGLASGGVSNLYYPASDRSGAKVTFEGAGIGLAGTAVQNLLQEFLIKKLTPGTNKQNTP